jgi:prepilin-type N-terminal cleavage/methylation domain-containing protein
VTPATRSRRHGLVLLEVMVALIILSLAGAGALQLAHQSHELDDNAREWSAAVAAAEDGMELAKLGSPALHGPPGDALPGGFRRQITRRPLASPDGFEQVTVTVFLPRGGRFDLERLARITDDGGEKW